MTSILAAIQKRFRPVRPIEPGVYHYQSPPYAEFPYRLHLRIEPGGEGILIIDASTILHLNQTAVEYAYHLVVETPLEKAVKQIGARYDISEERIRSDFNNFKDRIFTLIDLPDLDPVSFLEFERDVPFSGEISAPYRLDCALTYNLPPGADQEAAPTKRVDRELNTEEWSAILDKAWKAGIPHIVFTGGEPTLRPDLPDLIARGEANGQVTGLLTDGLRLADPGYLDTLLQTGLDHLMVVLNPEDDHCWQALDTILPQDIFTTVHLTLEPKNAGQISGILERLARMGTNAISLSDQGPELDEELAEMREYAADLGLQLVWDLPVPYSSRNPVALETQDEVLTDGAGKAWLYVEPDGDVLPAQGVNQVLGNLLREDWDSIWHKTKA
jgi:organic radical activating enzyme